jgi:hypothetical protein
MLHSAINSELAWASRIGPTHDDEVAQVAAMLRKKRRRVKIFGLGVFEYSIEPLGGPSLDQVRDVVRVGDTMEEVTDLGTVERVWRAHNKGRIRGHYAVL